MVLPYIFELKLSSKEILAPDYDYDYDFYDNSFFQGLALQ